MSKKKSPLIYYSKKKVINKHTPIHSTIIDERPADAMMQASDWRQQNENHIVLGLTGIIYFCNFFYVNRLTIDILKIESDGMRSADSFSFFLGQVSLLLCLSIDTRDNGHFSKMCYCPA